MRLAASTTATGVRFVRSTDILATHTNLHPTLFTCAPCWECQHGTCQNHSPRRNPPDPDVTSIYGNRSTYLSQQSMLCLRTAFFQAIGFSFKRHRQLNKASTLTCTIFSKFFFVHNDYIQKCKTQTTEERTHACLRSSGVDAGPDQPAVDDIVNCPGRWGQCPIPEQG